MEISWNGQVSELHIHFCTKYKSLYLDSTNVRLNEKALSLKTLYKHQVSLEEPEVPLDDDFPQTVLGWMQNGQELAESALEAPAVGSVESPKAHQELPSALELPTANTEFTPHPKSLGGRPAKQSPIRPRRTRKVVLPSPPPISHHQGPDLPSSPVRFRNYKKLRIRQESEAPTSPPPVVKETVSLQHKLNQAALKAGIAQPKAAALDDEAALFLEDLALLQGDFATWKDPQYQLRIEEANVMADMISQLAKTLCLGALVIADGGGTIKNLMSRVDTVNASTLDKFAVSEV